MRYALCISGYFSNKDRDNLMKSNYIKNNIIKKIVTPNSCDIFIHSFDYNNRNNILEHYNGYIKSYIIEPQIDFHHLLSIQNKEYLKQINKHNYTRQGYNIYSTLSFLYSRKRVIDIAIDYQKSQDFIYDGFVICRFDLGIRIKANHLNCNPGKFIFDPSLSLDYVYCAFWKQLNSGLADHWFVMNYVNANIFKKAYDYVKDKMFILNSEYIISLNTWIDSNIHDHLSNEILIKENKCKELARINFVDSLNNHIIIKFFCIKNDLYEKLKFLDYTNTI